MSLLDTLAIAGLIELPPDSPRPLPQFGNEDQEYQAAWKSVAIVIEHGFGMLTVTGEDRAKFLHNFCTNEIKKMQPGDLCEAFFCNVKGRVLALGIIICEADRFLILTDESRSEFLHQHLDRYIITEDVTLKIAEDVEPLLLVGNTEGLPDIAGLAVFAWDNGFRPACWLIGSTESLVESVKQSVAEGAIIAGHNAWEMMRISAAYPRYGSDISDENLAQEANRTEKAISFTKGCYLGQEPIARLDAMGHVNRQLERFYYIDSDHPPAVGTPVINEAEEEVGTITSTCQMSNYGVLDYERGMVLAMVKTKALGGTLTVKIADGQLVPLRKE